MNKLLDVVYQTVIGKREGPRAAPRLNDSCSIHLAVCQVVIVASNR